MQSQAQENLSWYRNRAGMLRTTAGTSWAAGLFLIVVGVVTVAASLAGHLSSLFGGIPLLLVGVYLSIAGYRAGVGVGPDGILIRNMVGVNVRIPWPEIKQFTIVRRRYYPQGGGSRANRGYESIAVNFADGREPLFISACSAAPVPNLTSWDWWPADQALGVVLNALENAQISALQKALENARQASQEPEPGTAP